MKTMKMLALAALLGVAGTAVAAGDAQAWGRHGGGWGGHWGGGPGGCGERETPLTTGQVKDIIEGKIAWRGENLTVAKVEDKDDATILAEVAKPDGTVVRRVQVDKKTGRFRPAE